MELSGEVMEEYDRLDREFFDKLPLGYRFVPTEQELILHYLNNKLSNLPSDPNRIRDMINLYSLRPQQLTSVFKLHRENAWYFFTKRFKSHGYGFWKATGVDAEEICDEKDIKIGTKVTLHHEDENDMETEWIMNEYRSEDGSELMNDEWVLCVIYKNTPAPEESNDIQQEANSPDGVRFDNSDEE